MQDKMEIKLSLIFTRPERYNATKKNRMLINQNLKQLLDDFFFRISCPVSCV